MDLARGTQRKAVLGALQVALICGAPLGQFAWGGQHRVLPARQRIGSAVGLVLYAVFAVAVLQQAGHIDVVPDPVATVGTWMAFGLLASSVLINAVSPSNPERYTMTPIALLLAVSALLVALG